MLQNYWTDVDIQDGYILTEPVTLDEAKRHCIITHSEDDAYIRDELIPACRASIEDYCNICIVERSVTATLRIENNIRLAFGGASYDQDNVIELPNGPVKGAVSVTRITSNGAIANLAEHTDYRLTGSAFKSIVVNETGDYIMLYTAGYSNTIPRDLKLAILNEIAFRYENRGDSAKTTIPGVCAAAQALADKHRRLWV